MLIYANSQTNRLADKHTVFTVLLFIAVSIKNTFPAARAEPALAISTLMILISVFPLYLFRRHTGGLQEHPNGRNPNRGA